MGPFDVDDAASSFVCHPELGSGGAKTCQAFTEVIRTNRIATRPTMDIHRSSESFDSQAYNVIWCATKNRPRTSHFASLFFFNIDNLDLAGNEAATPRRNERRSPRRSSEFQPGYACPLSSCLCWLLRECVDSISLRFGQSQRSQRPLRSCGRAASNNGLAARRRGECRYPASGVNALHLLRVCDDLASISLITVDFAPVCTG